MEKFLTGKVKGRGGQGVWPSSNLDKLIREEIKKAKTHNWHNCFNPLSLFELCFHIDWRLLVDWDISNI